MKIALIGAGGKMGIRLANNLKGSAYDVAYVEVSDAGRDPGEGGDRRRLCAAGCGAGRGGSRGVGGAGHRDRQVATGIVPKIAAGPIVVILDAAAPYAGHLPERADITYFVTHPCHPPIFNDEATEAAATTISAGSRRGRRS